MSDLITVGGKYTGRGLRRVALFTIVEMLVLTVWYYLLPISPVGAFVELGAGLAIEHQLAGQLRHEPGPTVTAQVNTSVATMYPLSPPD